jgi:hypothetical protein
MGSRLRTDVVFDECRITRGFRPLARHGWVIIRRDGSISLHGTKGDLIDAAHLGSTRVRSIPGARTVVLSVSGRTYIVVPRWGSRGQPSTGARAGLTAWQTLVGAQRYWS